MIVAVLSNECNSFVIYLTDLCVRKNKRRTLMRKMVIMAALLVFIGDRLGIDLYYVALLAFGFRIFKNLAILRRCLLRKR